MGGPGASEATAGQAPAGRRRPTSIATTLLWCFIALALVTVAATVVALVLFADVRRNLTEITDHSMREISASFGLVDEATGLASGVRLLADAADTDALDSELSQLRQRLGKVEELAAEYARLARPGQQATNLFTDELGKNIDALAKAVGLKLAAQQHRAELITALNRDHDAFIKAIGPIIATERDAMLASSRQAVRDGTAQIGTLIDGSFEALRAALQIEANTNYIAAILYLAAADDKVDVLEVRRSALVAPIASIKGALARVNDIEGGPELGKLATEIYRAAFEPENIIAVRRAILEAGAAPDPAAVALLRNKVHRVVALQAEFRRLAETVLGKVDTQILAANGEADAEGRQMIRRLREDLLHLETVLAINSDTNLMFGLLSLAGSAPQTHQLDLLDTQMEELRDRITASLGSFASAHVAHELSDLVMATLSYGAGDTSIFAARRDELAADMNARGIRQETEELTSLLTITAKVFASEAEGASGKAVDRMHASLARGQTILLALALSSFVLVAIIAWFFVYRHIVRWLKQISGLMHELAAGNLEVVVPAPRRNDEIGEMTAALSVFQTNAIRRRRAEAALKVAKDEAEQALAELKAAQRRLVQAEKMASLGQVTAGIAHEIKNPLNFVNNFASLSQELVDELHGLLEGPISGLEPDARADAEDLLGTVRGNLVKINQHGRRADSIVRNMLLHAREGPGERQAVNLNAIAEEALNVAYHGARVEHPDLQVELLCDLDPAAGEVECFPQELMRVLVNLVSNGIRAVEKRQAGAPDGPPPQIGLTTRAADGSVEVEVRDNGIGIPHDIREKIFQPFFTTKPAGQGTGLGLSLSYDIVVDQHGGELTVESEPGVSTVFRIVLPRRLPEELRDVRRRPGA